MHSRCAVAVAVLPLLAGCAGVDPTGPSSAAQAWLAALQSRDGAAVCALLAPDTRTELEQQSGSPCDRAVLAVELPDMGSIVSVGQWGQTAIVRLDADTLFLAHFGAGCKVIAAGCQPQGDKPYDCRVQGG